MSTIYFHRHGGKPERCLGGGTNEREQRQIVGSQPHMVVCMSMIPPELCKARLEERAKAREAERAKYGS